ncbi:hypothetical protein Lfu02_80650 [Longispora fulva]|uniref:Uncharacterized protein n=1 Tax=Longispora fulva TaxID=619741 RepID=A0A8J7GXK9_9ACTN|nr:hypothetical protein [Longispora fulva]MBG6140703.1 hypothetical protein [Longispora fulva]MBG6141155.1 hypothetical protein [Longispora fulva]GIG63693.1 hypothetical protein Lfu02_80650 [Longispora fulva]
MTSARDQPPPPDPIRPPRPFALRRWSDPTGVSGTGVVAHGVVWFDGRVELRWIGTTTGVTSSCSYDSIDDVLRVHGHGGRTEVAWLPEPSPKRWCGNPCPTHPSDDASVSAARLTLT